MRPGTIFKWVDQSAIKKQVEERPTVPLFLTAFSADKGPEKLMRVYGKDFYILYGTNPSFEKHGQPLIQAASIIDNGAELLCKRVVAPDATLANLTIVAKVKADTIQKTNAAGEYLYIDATTGEETTEANGNEAAMVSTAVIKYDALATSDVKTLDEVREEVMKYTNTEGTDGEFVYPLYIVTDNGRGKSSKRFRIAGDYSVSKNIGFQIYNLEVVSNVDIEEEYVRFSLNPEIIYQDASMSLSMTGKDLLQLRAVTIEENSEAMINKISEITGVSAEEIKTIDVLFGKDRKGKPIGYITIDEEGYDISEVLGLSLLEGSNGSFGDAPFGSDDYAEELINFYSGKFDETIFDVDYYKPEVCFDANYPLEVKKAIIDLALFREDFFYFRDMGIGTDSYESISIASGECDRNFFHAMYPQTFDILDPYSKKQITVTITYLMSLRMINHIDGNINTPCCGSIYGFTFPEVIEGSLNYTPRITPSVDQKTQLDDLFVNYATYQNDVLTMETTYTAQDPYTQLSYINNVMAIQNVMRALRNACPRFRYSFITTEDLDNYKSDVEAVLANYRDHFETLEFVYTQDPIMAANKIFNAAIKFRFKNFIQTEIFTLYALGD